MNPNLQLSARALSRARDLGVQIARTDPIIRPRLLEVSKHDNYARFRMAHRAYWEHSSRFETRWQEQLINIAERAASQQGLSEHDSIVQWELWYGRIVTPLSSAMWEAWESVHQLEMLYKQELLASAGRRETISIARIIRDGVSQESEAKPAPRRTLSHHEKTGLRAFWAGFWQG